MMVGGVAPSACTCYVECARCEYMYLYFKNMSSFTVKMYV